MKLLIIGDFITEESFADQHKREDPYEFIVLQFVKNGDLYNIPQVQQDTFKRFLGEIREESKEKTLNLLKNSSDVFELKYNWGTLLIKGNNDKIKCTKQYFIDFKTKSDDDSKDEFYRIDESGDLYVYTGIGFGIDAWKKIENNQGLRK